MAAPRWSAYVSVPLLSESQHACVTCMSFVATLLMCLAWMMSAVGDCSLYAAMIHRGAYRTCRHIDCGTPSLCRPRTRSSTWQYWPCVSTPSSQWARSAGGPHGLPTAPLSTSKTGHGLVHSSLPPPVTTTTSHLTGFHCDK